MGPALPAHSGWQRGWGVVRSLAAPPVQAPEGGGGCTCPLQAERQRRGNIRRALEFCEEDLPGLVWAPMTGPA